MKNKKNKVLVKEINLKSITNNWIVFITLFIWFYITLLKTDYFKFFPLAFTDTRLFENFNFNFGKVKQLLDNFLVFIIICISCWGYGLGIFSVSCFKKIEDIFLKSILSFILGLGVTSLSVFFLGLFGGLYKISFIILIIVGVICFLTYLLLHSNTAKNAIKKFEFNFLNIVLSIIFIYSTFINLFGVLTPETFFDSQFYLLGLPNQWRLQNKISFNPYIFASLYPFNVNMLYLMALVLNNDITAKILHWSFGIASCVLVYSFLKRYFSKTMALIAVVIFYTVPTVMAVSWKTAIELGITMFEIAMVLCMMEYFIKKEKFWLILSGIFAGFALGSKYLVLLEFFSISISFFVFKLVLEKERFLSSLKSFLYFLIPALIVASPWYIRNLILTGNPVFPFFAHKVGFIKPRVVGNIFADPPFPKFSFKNYFLFLWPLTLGQLQQESYPGGVFLAFFPLLFMFKNVDRRIKFLSIYVLFCILLWSTIGRFYLRYFIPVLSIVAIIYGYFLSENNFSKFIKTVIYFLLIFIICSNINFAMRILQITQTPAQFFFTDMSIKEYLSTQRPSYPCPYYQVVDWINKNLPKDSTILLLGETRGLFFERKFLTHGVLEYSPLIETLKKVDNSTELYNEFKKQNITHILLNVPEAKRLAGYDNFYFEPREFKIWYEFWNKHVKEIYCDIADIALPDRGIFSMRKQLPQWWQQYTSDPKNYVYLYEIVPETDKIPHNFFLYKELYSEERWQKLKDIVEEILKSKK
ncbi:MAG: glycosyltransferase family 39 protein [Elusimicrobiota bacterium]|nr:glycosyltransferase family 39 protein [Endomicrobiia bacterium]MDW8165530.1 glycosyltransferase family 39 protein [Elusimicrobiota bacterium]